MFSHLLYPLHHRFQQPCASCVARCLSRLGWLPEHLVPVERRARCTMQYTLSSTFTPETCPAVETRSAGILLPPTVPHCLCHQRFRTASAPNRLEGTGQRWTLSPSQIQHGVVGVAVGGSKACSATVGTKCLQAWWQLAHCLWRQRGRCHWC